MTRLGILFGFAVAWTAIFLMQKHNAPACTTYLVSSLTGDTVAMEGYEFPPVEYLAYVEEWWTEGCE